jgi:hypothetical protein
MDARVDDRTQPPEMAHMLETIAIVLLILWVLGLVSSYTLGGYIHVLLVVAVVVFLLRYLRRSA